MRTRSGYSRAGKIGSKEDRISFDPYELQAVYAGKRQATNAGRHSQVALPRSRNDSLRPATAVRTEPVLQGERNPEVYESLQNYRREHEALRKKSFILLQ